MLNNGKILIKNIDKAIAVVISFCLLLLSYFQFNAGLARKLDDSFSSSHTIYLMLVVFSCFIFFSFFHRKKHISRWLWPLCAYLVIGYLASTNLSIRNVFLSFVVTFWVFCFSFGGRLVDVGDEVSSFFVKTINFMIVLPLSLYSIFKFFTTNLIFNQGATDAYFAIIVYFPFVLMMEKKTAWKIILFVLQIIVAVLSIKRSIIIGMCVCLLLYVLLTERRRLFYKWYFWLLLVGIVVAGYYLYGIVSETIMYRFTRLEDDGGSGRDYIYKLIFSSFQQSGWQAMLFGHGYKSVVAINDWRLAHNDLLQLLYDFGIVGAGLYMFFLLSMFLTAIKKISKRKANKTMYAAFVSSIILFLFISFLNCFIYSTMLIVPIVMALGIMEEKIKLV